MGIWCNKFGVRYNLYYHHRVDTTAGGTEGIISSDSACLCFLLVKCIAHGFKSEEIWKNPCGLNTYNKTDRWQTIWAASTIKPLEPNHLKSVSQHLKDASKMMETFKLRYAQRLGHRHAAGVVIKSLPYMPKPDIPDGNMESSKQNITNTLLECYKKLSIVAVALEQVMYDETRSKSNTNTEDLNKHQSKLYDVLCNLSNVIRIAGSSIVNHVSSDVMSQEHRTVSSQLERFSRDFVVIEQSRILYEYIYKQLVKLQRQE